MSSALWETGDVLKRNRLNRISLGRITGIPTYDEDASGVVTVASLPVDGVTIAAVTTSYYAVPASGVAFARVSNIRLRNDDSVARVVSVYRVPSGGSANVASKMFADSINPGETVVLEGPFLLGPSGSIRAVAAAAAVVSLRAEVIEFAAQPGGLTFKVIDGVALTNALLGGPDGYYKCPSGVTNAYLLNALFCNTDASSRTPQLHIVPSGGSGSVATKMRGPTLVTLETIEDIPMAILQPGDFIDAKADAGSVVSMHLAVLEAT